MVTESPVKLMSDMGMRGGGGGGGIILGGESRNEGSFSEDLGKELGLILREQRQHQEGPDRELENIYRSGSAPPTVEGSRSAIGGIFGDGLQGNLSGIDEGLCADPNYSTYYYTHGNRNPRLPQPGLSKEDWRISQRLQGLVGSVGGGSGGGGGSVKLGGIGDGRKPSGGGEGDGSSKSYFSLPPGFNSKEEGEFGNSNAQGSLARQQSADWLQPVGDGLIGLSGLGLGTRQKSFADILQAPGNLSRPSSRNAFVDGSDSVGSADANMAQLRHELGSLNGSQPGTALQSPGTVQGFGSSVSLGYNAALGSSLSRSTTPDPQHIPRSPSPNLPPVGGRYVSSDKKTVGGPSSLSRVSSKVGESADTVAAALSGMSLSKTNVPDDNFSLQSHLEVQQNFLFDSRASKNQNHGKQHPFLKKSEPEGLNLPGISHSTKASYADLAKSNGSIGDLSNSTLSSDMQSDITKRMHTAGNSFRKAETLPGSLGSPVHYSGMDPSNDAFVSYNLGSFPGSPLLSSMMTNQLNVANLPPLYDNASSLLAHGIDTRTYGSGLPSGATLNGSPEMSSLNRLGNHVPAGLQLPANTDQLYLQYFQRNPEFVAQAVTSFDDPLDRNYSGNAYVDLLQRAYIELLAQQKSQYGIPYISKTGGLNHGYYGNAPYGVGMAYPGGALGSSVLPVSPGGPGSPIRMSDRNLRFPSGARGLGGVMGSWHPDAAGNMEETFASSLLEEFKSNKTKSFELSEIVGHVVEFSADQYGSRFIQQKLETATTEEKNMVFQEIMPQAKSLMTDVFGNYVIQKFFEHGTPAQRRELADQLSGDVLNLSLQMYGCRVIQKAIEVVDLDQQTKMVKELDGHIMPCVRDQNGNHVIQKCIECIPQDAINFIISSFYNQVVTLSTHPYGCRVIQRVLEHCSDAKTQSIMMDEILESVCMLAEDQYGNYVVQHVLEHGKPQERTSIIKKLAGQIVRMSQQKFASNVVEKCLTFGGPEERQFLVSEMLGATDENEPLQAMMKDQFANYVVQKVLETCDDYQRELILTRIKVHLNALKKYTYGKHIVARVEKLVTAGERRIGLQASHSS